MLHAQNLSYIQICFTHPFVYTVYVFIHMTLKYKTEPIVQSLHQRIKLTSIINMTSEYKTGPYYKHDLRV